MLLQVSKLTVRRGAEVNLRDMNFEVQPRECVLIRSQILLLGTSLLQALLGLEERVSGEVRFNGQNLTGRMPLRRRLELRRDIGYVHRIGGLISLLNVRDNLVLPLCYHAQVTRREVASLAEEIADDLDIADLLDREVDELGTMQARLVNLARALVTRPQLLLVDAILEGMDASQRQRVVSTINRYREDCGFGVVMTTRSRDFPQTDRVYELRDEGLHPATD